MRKKVLLVVSVIIVTLLAFAYVSAADDIRVVINGNELITDTPPRVINGSTMIPLRTVSEAIGCTVIWFEPEKRIDIYAPTSGDMLLSMFIDRLVIERYVYDKMTGNTLINEEETESSPVIIDGKTFVPLRLIAEAINFRVDWDETTKTIYLQSVMIATMEQARNFLYENYVDAELFYPGELTILEGDAICYGFVFDNGDRYRYVWVNSMTGEVKFADEVEDYTRTGGEY